MYENKYAPDIRRLRSNKYTYTYIYRHISTVVIVLGR